MKSVKLGGGLQFTSNEVKVKIKKLVPEGVIPEYSRVGDAGLDLVATSMTETDMYIEYGTGIAISLPENFVGLIYPRSSLSNYDLILANHVGVIDQNYRGEVKFRFKKAELLNSAEEYTGFRRKYYSIGDRIGQLIVQEIPAVVFEEVEELEQTNRGDKGYGSSGV